MGKGQELYRKAKTLIPGGTQLLSKRPEMFLPEHWPAYYAAAQGCEVVDLDGQRYHDLSYMGIGSCILGYADPDVNAAVIEAVQRGSMCTLNAPEEVELAELLIELHPWAEMVRYGRTGGEAMSIAVRIARAASGRDKVLFCGYHGWHDWYLAANLGDQAALDGHLLPGLRPAGVPRELRASSHPFNYNNTAEFLELITRYDGEVAAVVMEPIRNFEPEPGFFATIRQVCNDKGITLIVDEITAGFRLNVGGAHLKFGIEPDLAVFAKGLSNGFAMSAIIGRAAFMNAAQDSFISSTYWTERTGPAAALATLKKLRRENVPEHLVRIGQQVMQGWRALGEKHGLAIHTGGIAPLGHFSIDNAPEPLVAKTFYTQEMLKRGFLATTACYVAWAHTSEIVDAYLSAADEVFGLLADGLARGDLAARLEGPVCHAGFKRLS
jgi:glutamate-1-semialdehyde aminotransferase